MNSARWCTAALGVSALAVGSAVAALSHAGKPPVTVPLSVRGGVGTATGATPVIRIKVGNGFAIPVVLDTGSVGLHVYSAGVPSGAGSGVTRTNHANSISYVDGTQQTGIVAKAKITVGSLTTSQPISFGLITKVGCVSSHPQCPTRNGMQALVRSGRYGTMGIGIVPSGGLPPNPLLYLGPPYSQSWSIGLSGSGGKLVLGVANPSKPIAVLKMPSANGVPGFNDRKMPVCWTLGKLKHCGPTLFDSGEASMKVFGGPLAQAPKITGTKRAAPNQPVAAATSPGGVPFWKFSTGTTTSDNVVSVARSGSGIINTGIAPFFAFKITVDALTGRLQFSAPS